MRKHILLFFGVSRKNPPQQKIVFLRPSVLLSRAFKTQRGKTKVFRGGGVGEG
jgi:hypothetical protein